MNAKLTRHHTLYIAQAGISTGKVTPDDPQLVPGTWGSWILHDELVKGSQFELGFGDFEESFKRAAYDQSVELLQRTGISESMISFDDLEWRS